ncbi:MAG: hypothetical protein AVDCRST_MAG13-229, partial [uncultured Solirubrobacteraceae bacterium]
EQGAPSRPHVHAADRSRTAPLRRPGALLGAHLV